jgi:threonine/homoserine/homoserine lactone efflux protein
MVPACRVGYRRAKRRAAWGLTRGSVFCTMTFVWLTAYAFAVAKAGDVLRRPAIKRAFDAVLGAVLVALGLRLATERR